MNMRALLTVFTSAALTPCFPQTNNDTLHHCDTLVQEVKGEKFYLFFIDEWTLWTPWDHYGEPAAIVISTSRPELDPGQLFKLTDSMYVLADHRGFPEFLGRCDRFSSALEALGHSRYSYPPYYGIGQMKKRRTRWAFKRWRIRVREWSEVRFLTTTARTELLNEKMSLDMMCLDPSERPSVRVAIALPLSER